MSRPVKKMFIALCLMFGVIGMGGFAAGKLLKNGNFKAEHSVTFMYAFASGMLCSYAFSKAKESAERQG